MSSSEQEKLTVLKIQHRSLETSHRDCLNNAEKAKQAIVRHQRQIKALENDIDRQEVEIQDLKDVLEKDTPQTGLLEQYERNLSDAQDTKRMNEDQYKDSIIEKDKLGQDARPLKDQLNVLADELGDLDARIKKVESRLEKATNKREEDIRKANLSHERVGDARKAKAAIEADRDEQVARVNDFTEQAETISQRIPVDVGETAESLEAKLKKLQREKLRQRDE